MLEPRCCQTNAAENQTLTINLKRSLMIDSTYSQYIANHDSSNTTKTFSVTHPSPPIRNYLSKNNPPTADCGGGKDLQYVIVRYVLRLLENSPLTARLGMSFRPKIPTFGSSGLEMLETVKGNKAFKSWHWRINEMYKLMTMQCESQSFYREIHSLQRERDACGGTFVWRTQHVWSSHYMRNSCTICA